MGTERSIEYEGPCLCGKGFFRIDDCQVDHGWPTAMPQWYETRIDCPVCSEKFSIEERGARFVLIERSLLREHKQKHDQHQKKIDTKKREIFTNAEVLMALNRVEELINKQKSVAAIYRLFKGANLVHCSIATFRKRWTNIHDWKNSYFEPKGLLKIFNLVDIPTDNLQIMLNDLERLKNLVINPPEIYGEPIYVVGGHS